MTPQFWSKHLPSTKDWHCGHDVNICLPIISECGNTCSIIRLKEKRGSVKSQHIQCRTSDSISHNVSPQGDRSYFSYIPGHIPVQTGPPALPPICPSIRVRTTILANSLIELNPKPFFYSFDQTNNKTKSWILFTIHTFTTNNKYGKHCTTWEISKG